VPHVVGPWYALPPPELDQWEVMLGSMRLTINANSHQAAKRVAVAHWAACSADADNFRRALAARIAEKWRGGIKARRIVRHNAEVRGDAPLYGAASLSTDGFGGADNGERK
jgi:hypothetical protein